MDKNLIRNAMVNSGILTLVLGINTLSALGAGGLAGAIFAAIGIYATYITGRDTARLYKALN